MYASEPVVYLSLPWLGLRFGKSFGFERRDVETTDYSKSSCVSDYLYVVSVTFASPLKKVLCTYVSDSRYS